jgi:hypothetical protein
MGTAATTARHPALDCTGYPLKTNAACRVSRRNLSPASPTGYSPHHRLCDVSRLTPASAFSSGVTALFVGILDSYAHDPENHDMAGMLSRPDAASRGATSPAWTERGVPRHR